MNHVGQVIQMNGTGITTCLIVERVKLRWDDLWNWKIIVLDHEPHPSHACYSAVHKTGDVMVLNNQYIEKYSWPVTSGT